MSYVNGLGAVTNDQVLFIAEQVRDTANDLMKELSGSSVARVFAPSTIDATATLVASVNQAIDKSVKNLLARGTEAGRNEAVNLLRKVAATLESERVAHNVLWAQTGMAGRLLITVTAGLVDLAEAVAATPVGQALKKAANAAADALPSANNTLAIVGGVIVLAIFVKIAL